MATDVRVLFSEREVRDRVAKLAAQITADYAPVLKPDENLLMVGVLRGAFVFLADLARGIHLPVEIDFVRAESYRNGKSSANLTMAAALPTQVCNRHVLLVEDMADTGKTLQLVVSSIAQGLPASLKVACLIDRALPRERQPRPDYVGFHVQGRQFLVGYGLDHAGRYRELPYIGALE
ncbi:MAG: hypoxanthine phosphoribosyltransferase [Candidatus Aenigmarchaeota archaeon]|nr:hypoxanthine phosphoribosyltransferase [Candidatus Aenigmarchaeota archaeon]